jgi:predicted xylan-binding protein with Ca-dependent carbohydrate-binding module/parallel beta helix pectate lyase-like protein
MANFGHSDWIFEHSTLHDHHDLQSSIPAPPSSESGWTPSGDGLLGLLKALWHQSDIPSGSGSSGLATSQLALLHPSAQVSGSGPSPQAPNLTIGSDALTVTEGGSIALPISVTPTTQGDPVAVTITGLASYETLTDGLDHHVFSGNTVVLTGAEVASGLTLTSNYMGPDHPVNTLSITASELIDHQVVTSAAQTIVVTDPPATSTSTATTSSGNPLTLQVSGDNLNGTDPQFQVFVDGQQVGSTYAVTADHTAGQTQTITINGNFDPLAAHQVQIKFINDGWDGTSWWTNGTGPDGHDVNLYVDSISLNGTTMTGAQGTNGAANGIIPATHGTEAVMDVNGALSFNVPADPPATTTVSGGTANTGSGGSGTSTGSSGNPLTLQVSGDNLNGTDPQFQVFVDGQQVGSTYAATADHAAGQTQTITINGNFDPLAAHQVQIKFINDGWDGTSWWTNGTGPDGHDVNLYVESISLNGTTMTGVQGTNGAANGIIPATNGTEAVMDVNGALSFNVPADPPATTPTGTVTNGTVNTSSGGSGTSSGSVDTASTGAGASPSGPGFFVSANGNDSNPGTVDAPFATLERAQQAMENSSIKQTYVEGGTYHLSNTLTLTAADSGETWTYYPPSGVDTAIIDGSGLGDIIDIQGSNITINGLQLQHASNAGITVQGPNHNGGFNTTNDIIENSVVHDLSNIDGAAISSWGATNVKIYNNLIYNVTSKAIAAEATQSGDIYSGTDIENNVILNSVTNNQDNGAIYLQDLNGGASTNIIIKNNFIHDYGSASNFTKGIYLDDGASNTTVTGNIISGSGQFAVQYHGGDNNHVSGNLIDLGSAGNQFIAFYQMSPSETINNMAGNTFTDNVIIGAGGSQVLSWATNISGQALPTDSNNVYHSYGSGGISTGADGINDSNPIFEDPQLSGWTYNTAAGSPIQIIGGWGPAGYIIPQTGTTPSV